MQSRSVGVALALATLTFSPVATSAPGPPGLRLTASQGGLVTERSIATSRGVETTARLSDLTGEDIVLVYAVAGSAAARVAEDGRSVALRIEAGGGSLRLGELTVRDASGRDLPARWSIASEGPRDTAVRLEIDASGALEPVWIAAALEPLPIARAKTRIPAERAPASTDAAAPSNDTCPGAEIVPGAGPFPWSTATHDVSGATTTGDPPLPTCQPDISRSIWFRFTPAATTEYTFSLCSEAPTATTLEDTVLAIYASPDGTCSGGLQEIAGGCDDDSCNGFQSSIWNVRLLAGRTYFVVAYSYGTAAPPLGRSSVQLRVTEAPPVAPPPNDRCEQAEVIPGGGPFPALSAVAGDVSGAGADGDPAPPACQANVSRSLWYRFAPGASGRYEISTCADGPTATTLDDTVLAIYRSDGGSCADLVPLAGGCDDDGCAREARQSTVSGVELEAGATYFVLVHTFGASRPAPGSTSAQLRVARTLPPPANDTCSGAEAIPSAAELPYLTSVSENRDATSTGDPLPSCRSGATRGLWYRFQPTVTDRFEIALCAAAPSATTLADTVLAVYASSDGSCVALVPVDGGCNDDGCLDRADQSFLGSIELSGNTTYYFVAQQAGDTRFGPADARVQLRLGRALSGGDGDGDGVPDAVDCAPADATAWDLPGPATDLGFGGDREQLTWLAPAAPGGTGLRYDLLRSTTSDGFGAPTCLEWSTPETESIDASVPRPLFAYLVRSHNACGGGAGSDSAGRARETGACP